MTSVQRAIRAECRHERDASLKRDDLLHASRQGAERGHETRDDHTVDIAASHVPCCEQRHTHAKLTRLFDTRNTFEKRVVNPIGINQPVDNFIPHSNSKPQCVFLLAVFRRVVDYSALSIWVATQSAEHGLPPSGSAGRKLISSDEKKQIRLLVQPNAPIARALHHAAKSLKAEREIQKWTLKINRAGCAITGG